MTDPVGELDISDEAKDALRQIKAEVEAAYAERLAHLTSRVEAVDSICDAHGVPTQQEDGSQIVTEDRVQLLLASQAVDIPPWDEHKIRWLIGHEIPTSAANNELYVRASELLNGLRDTVAVLDATRGQLAVMSQPDWYDIMAAGVNVIHATGRTVDRAGVEWVGDGRSMQFHGWIGNVDHRWATGEGYDLTQAAYATAFAAKASADTIQAEAGPPQDPEA
jgi:hypothetical protein